MHYVVHLPAPKHVVSRLVEVRRRISPVKLPKLEDHCTLALGEFEERNEQALVKTLSLHKYDPLDMTLQGDMELFHPDILVALVEPTKKLQKTHEAVLNRIAPLRSMRLTKPLAEEFRSDPERVKLYEKYGSPFVRSMYRPHVSIGVVNGAPTEKSLDILTGVHWVAQSYRLSKRVENGYILVKDFKK